MGMHRAMPRICRSEPTSIDVRRCHYFALLQVRPASFDFLLFAFIDLTDSGKRWCNVTWD